MKLNFYNKSKDNDARIMLFCKNINHSGSEAAFVWKIIKNCGQNEHHSFEFSNMLQITSCDSDGNFTAEMDAIKGQQYIVKDSVKGDTLWNAGTAKAQMTIY